MKWGLAGLTGLVLGLAACAARTIPPGPEVQRAIMDQDHFIMSDGARLPMRVWAPQDPPKAVVLALHGMNDYSFFFQDAGHFLADRGILSYAYDQRGFGQGPHPGFWSSHQALADDARTVLGLLKGRHPDLPLFLLGESMGGGVAILATQTDLPAIRGVILSAPAVWGRSGMGWVQRFALWLGYHLAPGWRPSGKGLNIQASDNMEMLRALGTDPLFIKETRIDAVKGVVDLMDAAQAGASQVRLPALLLYGANDQVIPEDPIWSAASHLPQGQTAFYPTGWHMLMRDLNARIVLEDIAHWVLEKSGPLPSGAMEQARMRQQNR